MGWNLPSFGDGLINQMRQGDMHPLGDRSIQTRFDGVILTWLNATLGQYIIDDHSRGCGVDVLGIAMKHNILDANNAEFDPLSGNLVLFGLDLVLIGNESLLLQALNQLTGSDGTGLVLLWLAINDHRGWPGRAVDQLAIVRGITLILNQVSADGLDTSFLQNDLVILGPGCNLLDLTVDFDDDGAMVGYYSSTPRNSSSDQIAYGDLGRSRDSIIGTIEMTLLCSAHGIRHSLSEDG